MNQWISLPEYIMSDFIHYAQSIDDAALTIDTMTSDANYPLTNLQDRNKSVYWKEGTGNTSGYIQIDLVTARACDFLILGNHNYTDTGKGIALSSCTDGDGDFTPEAWAIGSAGPTYHDYVSGNVTNWMEIFTSVNKRYWRLYLEAMGAVTYQQIATIFLGTKWNYDHNPELTVGEESGYKVRMNEAEGGARFSQIANTTVRKEWDYDYKYIIASEKTKFETWRDAIYMSDRLSRYPFFFSDDTGTSLYYVRAAGKLSLKEQAYNVWQTRISLEEEL